MIENIKKQLPEKSPAEIEKEMEKCPIVTFADIVRALKAHPDWLEEIRKIILTTELIELPKKFEELLKRIENLENRVEKIEQDVAILKQDVAILKQDVAVLKKDMKYLKGEFGRFKGKEFERTIRERYYAYFGRLLRKSKLIPFEKLLPVIDDLEEKGVITEKEREELLNVDLVISGEIKRTKKSVVLAAEVSYSLQQDDLERAYERACILSKVLNKEVIPVVVFVEAKEEMEKLGEDKGVLLIQVEY